MLGARTHLVCRYRRLVWIVSALTTVIAPRQRGHEVHSAPAVPRIAAATSRALSVRAKRTVAPLVVHPSQVLPPVAEHTLGRPVVAEVPGQVLPPAFALGSTAARVPWISLYRPSWPPAPRQQRSGRILRLPAQTACIRFSAPDSRPSSARRLGSRTKRSRSWLGVWPWPRQGERARLRGRP